MRVFFLCWAKLRFGGSKNLIDLLVIVSNPDSGKILLPLANACADAGIGWAVFFTNDGVVALANENLVKALASTSQAVVGQESWDKHMDGIACPLELGSQTNNSAILAEAKKVLGL